MGACPRRVSKADWEKWVDTAGSPRTAYRRLKHRTDGAIAPPDCLRCSEQWKSGNLQRPVRAPARNSRLKGDVLILAPLAWRFGPAPKENARRWWGAGRNST